MNTRPWDLISPQRFRPWQRWQGLRQIPPGTALSGLFLLLVLAAAVHPALFTHSDPFAIAPRQAFRAPDLQHWLGTDPSGRDVFARLVYGTRQSLVIGVSAMTLAMGIALLLGLTAGLGGRRLDALVSAGLNVCFAFPPLVLALLMVAAFGTGLLPLIIATGVGASPGYARMVRGQVLGVRQAGYIQAARVLGHAPAGVLLRQVIPNTLRPLVVTLTMGIGQMIVWASALSFLGLGEPPPSPEWGTMLSMGRDFVATAWWLTCMPGLVIVLVALTTTVLGRHLQRKLEGRLA